MSDQNLIFDKSADRTQTLVRLCIALSSAYLGMFVLKDLLAPLHDGLLAGRLESAGVAISLTASLTVAFPPTLRWRETLWVCLAAIIAGAQCALALIGAAVLSAHWQPEAATSLPRFAGMLAAAPVPLGTAIYFIRRRKAALRNQEEIKP